MDMDAQNEVRTHVRESDGEKEARVYFETPLRLFRL